MNVEYCLFVCCINLVLTTYKKNRDRKFLVFLFLVLEIIPSLVVTSRCKRNYNYVSTGNYSRKSFFFHNEMKKKTLSHLDFFNTLISKTFCRFSFCMTFLHFKFPDFLDSSSRETERERDGGPEPFSRMRF